MSFNLDIRWDRDLQILTLANLAVGRWKFNLFYAWWDAWLGWFLDRQKRYLYFCFFGLALRVVLPASGEVMMIRAQSDGAWSLLRSVRDDSVKYYRALKAIQQSPERAAQIAAEATE